MDRAEARNRLRWQKAVAETTMDREALDLAIEALEREIEYGQMVVDYIKGEAVKSDDWEYTNTPTDTPIEDCVSRETVLSLMRFWGEVYPNDTIMKMIESLPPVTLKAGGDCISRQDAIEALDRIGSLDTEADREYAKGIFDGIPPVTPTERPKGKWIFKTVFPNDKSEFPLGYLVCPICGSQHANATPCNYCDNCGARMK